MANRVKHTSSITLKKTKRKKKWQIMAINDSGKILFLGGFRKFYVMILFFFLLVLVAGGWGGLQYKNKNDEVLRLQGHLEAAIRQMKTIRNDMDVLLYRITNADSLTDLKAAMELESATVPEEADKASVTDAGDAGQKSSADSNTNSANE